ncbi:MAG: hypothetical protein ACREAC_17080, partial [Blastocatellia bacterium]
TKLLSKLVPIKPLGTKRAGQVSYDREKRQTLDLWNTRLLAIVSGNAPSSDVHELPYVNLSSRV